MSIELRPAWGGFLGIDGKVIFVRGSRNCLLLGVDHPTQDIVHALVLPAETADEVARLATEARLDARHPLSGVVADLGPGFVQAHRDHFGATPFQACRVHFDRRLDSDIPKARWSAQAPLYRELKARVRAMLYAPTYDEARRLLNALIDERARFKGIGRYDTIRTLERNFDAYTAHYHTPGLPADNNVTENVIKQLNKKLRLIEGFESLESAEGYVRLLVGCYRFKRFTDSCRRADNGKAPLELAGVDIAGRDGCRICSINEAVGARNRSPCPSRSRPSERADMAQEHPWGDLRQAASPAPNARTQPDARRFCRFRRLAIDDEFIPLPAKCQRVARGWLLKVVQCPPLVLR